MVFNRTAHVISLTFREKLIQPDNSCLHTDLEASWAFSWNPAVPYSSAQEKNKIQQFGNIIYEMCVKIPDSSLELAAKWAKKKVKKTKAKPKQVLTTINQTLWISKHCISAGFKQQDTGASGYGTTGQHGETEHTKKKRSVYGGRYAHLCFIHLYIYTYIHTDVCTVLYIFTSIYTKTPWSRFKGHIQEQKIWTLVFVLEYILSVQKKQICIYSYGIKLINKKYSATNIRLNRWFYKIL